MCIRDRLKPQYLRFKKGYRKVMSVVPGGKAVYRVTHKIKKAVKDTLLPCSLFEDCLLYTSTDCVAFIGDNSVSVVVSNNGAALTDADVAKIAEIVTDETGMAASQIKIIEATE